jgi:hypothetical protein
MKKMLDAAKAPSPKSNKWTLEQKFFYREETKRAKEAKHAD